jgi:predicted dehydrogenase/threonine dehydrogenase-like Zn-dependent dehydrogenase
MKQVLQDLKTGAVVVTDTPDPAPAPGRLLVRVQTSLLSAGTESAQVAKARQSLFAKIRQKPELLRKGLDEFRERGLEGIREKIASKYEGFGELGYSCAGTVVHCGDESALLAPGTLVACAGAGIANHSEFVSVPALLTAVAPEGVSAEAAAYATVGAIAMQGVRQANAQLGEYIAVIGLGLVGLLTAQLLRAAGCRVVGIDPAPSARQRALASGCDAAVGPAEALDATLALSGGVGADAVIICAATAESSPVEMAGKIARSRGRVVMVGATGMNIPREEYFLKELSFTLSRSYGPGRYDSRYEEEGRDYPIDHVRFTEQRNLRAFLELVQKQQVNPALLTTHRFPLAEAPAAYALLNNRAVDRAGIVLQYSEAPAAPEKFSIQIAPAKAVPEDTVGIGFIGAGAYAQGMLLPLLKKRSDVALRSVLTRNGSHALHAGKRFGFESAGTRVEDLLGNPAVNAVFITTRHDSHAELTCQALRAGKHVWVEKPLALSLEELREVARALRENNACRLVVGFNRPFSPDARFLFQRLGGAQSRLMHYRVNAGQVPADSWVNDPKLGGGRLLGEGCHFFDFLRRAAGAEAVSVQVEATSGGRADLPPTANFAANVSFANGSVGQLLYSAQGSPALPKEHFECFSGQNCGVLHDYRNAEFFVGSRREEAGRHAQDKGQAALLDAFIHSLRDGPPAMTPEEVLESSLLTLAAQQSLSQHQSVRLAEIRHALT